jgi:hypothetical protein
MEIAKKNRSRHSSFHRRITVTGDWKIWKREYDYPNQESLALRSVPR